MKTSVKRPHKIPPAAVATPRDRGCVRDCRQKTRKPVCGAVERQFFSLGSVGEWHSCLHVVVSWQVVGRIGMNAGVFCPRVQRWLLAVLCTCADLPVGRTFPKPAWAENV